MSEFQREDRYIVIKRSDLERLRGGQTEGLRQQLSKVYPLLPKRQCAVIESDWPEFEQVWRMIEARVAGNPLPDYDALAAQRDEGLAREARLRSEISIYQNEYVKYSEFEELQQRLTEAEKLLSMHRELHALVPDGYTNPDSPGCADGEKS